MSAADPTGVGQDAHHAGPRGRCLAVQTPEFSPGGSVLNHSLDLLVQAVELVDDLSGLRLGLQAYAALLPEDSDSEAVQVGRVWTALDLVVGAVQARREDSVLAALKEGATHGNA